VGSFCMSVDNPVMLGGITSFVDALLSKTSFGFVAACLSSLVLVIWDDFLVRLARALSKQHHEQWYQGLPFFPCGRRQKTL